MTCKCCSLNHVENVLLTFWVLVFFFFFAVVFFKKNYKYIKIIYFLFLHDLKIFKKLILKKSSFFF